ncbi:MAG: hypothetical protein ACRC6I_21905 [Paracoccaceae bacterium]
MGKTPKPLGPTSTPAQAGGAAAATPANATTLCCWCDKFEKQVAAHGSTYVLSSQHPNHNVKFKLTVDFIGGEVVITRVLKWGTVAAAVTDAEKAAIRTGLTSTVSTIWSGKYRLKVTDATCNPTTKTLPIRFRLAWEGTGGAVADMSINLVVGPKTSAASGTFMNLDTKDVENGGYTLAHEFGHTLGQVDEYMYGTATSGTADYKRANGTKVTITLPQTGNLMSTAKNMSFKQRFYYFIEIEAQKLLRSASGLGKAGVTCEIV